jgi:hypothetical protein
MKRYRAEEDDKENTLWDEPQQKKTRANVTPVKRVVRTSRTSKSVLSNSAITQIRRLGGVVPIKITPTPYRSNNFARPAPHQQFANIRWSLKSIFTSSQFQLRNITFNSNALVEWNKYTFLRANSDAIVIGAANDELLVSKQRPGEAIDHADFDVWIIDNQGQEGPFPLTMILTSMEHES